MGEDRGIYTEQFPKGSKVRVKDGAFLESFRQTWRLHNPLETEQLGYAGRDATVASVGFYHGGDVLYTLSGIPGIWHERCLEHSNEQDG
jgi:hypothetical protein